jgi:glucose-6-phosphate isomerase
MQRVSEPILEALAELAIELQVVKNFEAQLRGARLNQVQGNSSNPQPVLHTSLRFPTGSTPSWGSVASEAASQAFTQRKKLKAFLDHLNHGRLKSPSGKPFREMICIGIGGSELGPQALYLALEPHRNRPVHFLSNGDPDHLHSLKSNIQDVDATLVAVISKSGSTPETTLNESRVYDLLFKPKGIPKNQVFVSVTSPGSPLDDPSSYLEVFHIFDWVGGRFSTTSMAGGISLGFSMGAEVFEELLSGAHAMDLHALENHPLKNAPLLEALLILWNSQFLNGRGLAIVPYSHLLRRYPAHLQQLMMESNGKMVRRNGELLSTGDSPPRYRTSPWVFGEPGTHAEHSFFQLVHQHPGQEVSLEFIGFQNPGFSQDTAPSSQQALSLVHAHLLAQWFSLAQGRPSLLGNTYFPGNRPSSLLLSPGPTPAALGALLAFHEAVSAYCGYLWGINSWDQEGVELGKTLARRLEAQGPPGPQVQDPRSWVTHWLSPFLSE